MYFLAAVNYNPKTMHMYEKSCLLTITGGGNEKHHKIHKYLLCLHLLGSPQ